MNRRAFTVVEFIVASALAVVLFTGSALALEAALKSATINRSRDNGIGLAYNAANQARILDCGSVTGTPELKKSAQEKRALTPCKDAYLGVGETGGVLSVSPDYLIAMGSSVNSYFASSAPRLVGSTPGSRFTYALNSSVTWSTSNGSSCPTPAVLSQASTRPGTVDTRDYVPALLRYDTTVSWDVRNTFNSRRYSVSEPASLVELTAGRGVIVRLGATSSGARVTMSARRGSNTGVEVARIADEAGCAWFPFLSEKGDVVTLSYQLPSATRPTTSTNLITRDDVGNNLAPGVPVTPGGFGNKVGVTAGTLTAGDRQTSCFGPSC